MSDLSDSSEKGTPTPATSTPYTTRQGGTQLAPGRGQRPKTGGKRIGNKIIDPCGRTHMGLCDHKGREIWGAS
ncbi:hypothetical protein CE91St14_22140 [Porphyromonas somerae]|nr:hypothetical protein CE91St14_22140 [Porphyromonas somerae]